MSDSPNFTGREKEAQNMDTNDGARVKDCDVLRNFRYSSKLGDLMINLLKSQDAVCKDMHGIFATRGACHFVTCSVNNGSIGVEYDG